MTLYSIDPRDPIVLRDGRPNDGRSQSGALPFVPPSVFAGVARSALGRGPRGFEPDLVPELLEKVSLRGPLLAGAEGLYLRAPGDALVVRGGESLRVRALRPLPPLDRAACSADLDRLVGLPRDEVDGAKSERGAPAYWRWAAFEEWLRRPGTREGSGARELLTGGLQGFVNEQRVHVALGETFTAEEGMLFGTSGLRGVAMRWADREDAAEPQPIDVSLRVSVEVSGGASFPGTLDGLRPLAGERRLARWSLAGAELPEVPAWLREHAAGDRPLVRLVLLTPAFVEESARPRFLEEDPEVELVAARIDRPQTISGWDLRKRWPKRTRRLVPAGSVYWLRLRGGAEANRSWVERHWMTNVGDDAQLCRDGFGLAVVGVGTEEQV